MGLSKSVTYDNGVTVTYHRLMNFGLELNTSLPNKAYAILGSFIDKAASDAGKRPVQIVRLGSDFTGTNITQTQVYAFIKTLDGWTDAIDA